MPVAVPVAVSMSVTLAVAVPKALLFLLVILNVFIAQYITKIDYNKYIPNNKIGKIFKLFINRYINLWSKSVQLLLIIG